MLQSKMYLLVDLSYEKLEFVHVEMNLYIKAIYFGSYLRLERAIEKWMKLFLNVFWDTHVKYEIATNETDQKV